jgi:hypothetical protein
MGNQNDAKIMDLRAKILEKKDKLKGKKRFVPVTNCSLELDGVRYNIQATSKDKLLDLLIRINAYRMSAEKLCMSQTYTVSGFILDDWITDILARLDIIAYREEESKLQEMENKLHDLLSTDKKVELEIDSIKSMLD